MGEPEPFEDGDTVASLRAAFRPERPGAGTAVPVTVRAAWERQRGTQPVKPGRSSPLLRSRWRVLSLAVGLIALTAGISFGAQAIINLGKPTNAIPANSFFPLSGFYRMPLTVRHGKKAELLVISGASLRGPAGPEETVERWPIVKALEQFGALTGLQPLDRPTVCSKIEGKAYCVADPSTIDWSHARYHSRYLVFVHRDLYRYESSQDTFVSFQSLSGTARMLYRKYVQHASRSYIVLPLIATGNYVQVTTQVPLDGDFQMPLTTPTQQPSYLSFATIQTALETGKDPPGTKLVEDVNAEANVITALICHADGSKPKSVCTRPAIKSILKHVH